MPAAGAAAPPRPRPRLAGLLSAALAAGARGREVRTSPRLEYYSQNALCRQSNCINPLFPGLNDLPRLEQLLWQCTTHEMVARHVNFCKDVVVYDPALPSPNATSRPVEEIVRQQDDAAATMYFYHLSGLGYEAGEHQRPARSSEECVKSVWRMACFSYFPKVQAGCQRGEATPYLRPCRGCCERYIEACGVECCDESVQCVFRHTVTDAAEGFELVQTGYAEERGPSALCTGSGSLRLGAPLALLLGLLAAHAVQGADASGTGSGGDGGEGERPRCRGPGARGADGAGRCGGGGGALLAGVFAVCALALQGCEVSVPHHHVGNWRSKPDYLVAFEFIRPGQPASSASLNSCSEEVPETLQCSGRGYCKEWAPSLAKGALRFCECNHEWADPECRTRRKSQITTFLCALFGGFFGADYFYLGYPGWAFAKLCTLGGLGAWWLVDVVRTGAGPVYAYNFRVANDLPHWVFVLSTVTLFGVAGFLIAIESYMTYRKNKRDDVMKLHQSEEVRQLGKMEDYEGPRYRLGVPGGGFDAQRLFAGYGATLPAPLSSGAAPYAMPPQGGAFASPWGHGARF